MSKRILLAMLLAGALARADDARRIIGEMQARARVASLRYEGSLRTIRPTGKSSEKRWLYQRIGSWGRARVLLRFTAPAEVKGVALLIVHYPDRQSDQWMWTPATARERRIAVQNRSARFFGLDFSFEDLEERDAEQHDYELLGEQSLDGEPCWRIRSRPRKTKASQYTDSLLWVRQQTYTLAQLENFAQDRVVRRLRCREMEKVQGVWTARLVEMSDLARGTRTILRLERLEYNVPLSPEVFTLQGLRAGP